MSMHLCGPGMTTTNYKKRKSKQPTKNQLEKIKADWKAYNKQMRRTNCHAAQFDTLEDYIAYTRGNYKPKAQKSETFAEMKVRKSAAEEQRKSHNEYPSLSNNVGGVAARKESQKYTGTLIKGIATMHKSNAVPILNKEEATDIANMRRN